MVPDAPADRRQRIDKWLWFARVLKSRTLAARLVEDGFVRINTNRIGNPAKAVRPGDVVTVALERHVRVLKVLEPGTRRGPFTEAQTLYMELSDVAAGEASDTRDRGA